MAGLVFSFDLEDHREDRSKPARYEAITRKVLELLDLRAVRGTFFVVGELALENADLVKEIARQGHELAFHGWDHEVLWRSNPDKFRDEARRGKALLEDISATAVHGYRAPVFSLVARTNWCVDVLHELGFTYTSSVLPASNPLFGYPEAPRQPFRWQNGIVEFPVPTIGFSKFQIPYLGGIYLRYLPMALVRISLDAEVEGRIPFTYLHPYDLDSEEGFVRIRGASWMTSFLLSLHRSASHKKLDSLLKRRTLPPFSEIVESGFGNDTLPIFQG